MVALSPIFLSLFNPSVCVWRWGSCQLLNYWNKGKISKAFYITLVPFHLMNDSLMSLFEIIIAKAITFFIIWMNTKHHKEKLWKDRIPIQQKRFCSQQVVYAYTSNSKILFASWISDQQSLPNCRFKKPMHVCCCLEKILSHLFLTGACLDFTWLLWLC